MHKSLEVSDRQTKADTQKMALALHQIGQLVKSQSEIISKLGERLNLVERAPVSTPRSVQGTAQPIQKSMPGEAGTPEMNLTKSEALKYLSYANLVKGKRTIGNRSTSDVICGLEAGGVWDQGLDAEVRSFAKSLTADERKAALSENY